MGTTQISPEDVAAFVGEVAEPPRVARYPVSEAMIRNWAEALDDRNPIYVDADAARATGRTGIVAPPAMISTWVMAGYRRYREVQELRERGEVEQTAYSRLLALFDRAGYTSVVATDVEQEFERETTVGTHVTCHLTIESVIGPKTTALGEGYFLTLGKRYVDEGGATLVSERFRMLRFRPKASA